MHLFQIAQFLEVAADEVVEATQDLLERGALSPLRRSVNSLTWVTEREANTIVDSIV